MQFVYPATLTATGPHEIVVSFRDLPEGLTSGADTREALAAAADALAEALAGRIDYGEPIPEPTPAEPDEHEVAVPPGMAAKAALAIAFRESGHTRVAFAVALGVHEKAVRRLLDPPPRHLARPHRQGAPLPRPPYRDRCPGRLKSIAGRTPVPRERYRLASSLGPRSRIRFYRSSSTTRAMELGGIGTTASHRCRCQKRLVVALDWRRFVSEVAK